MAEKKLVILAVLALSLALCYSESSKATYYGSPQCNGTPPGACGYGTYGKSINGGYVASVSRPYNHGLGCGACYAIKCKAAECNGNGVKVVATDSSRGNEADFVLSSTAFGKMARGGMEKKLMNRGRVDIEYNRVPCQYGGKNMMIKIHERSHNPHYLAFLVLYQGGMNDIRAVEIYEKASRRWRPCRRVYGAAIWDIQDPPRCSLTVRFLVTKKWVSLNNVIPMTWKAGVVYGTSVQLS